MLIIIQQLQKERSEHKPWADRSTAKFTCQICVRTTRRCGQSDTEQSVYKHIHVEITDPFDDSMAFRNVFQLNEMYHGQERRFLMHHVDTSLIDADCNDDAANKARKILELYRDHLAYQIKFPEFLDLANREPVEIEIVAPVHGPVSPTTHISIHQLHWEVLENNYFKSKEMRLSPSHITLRRRLIQVNEPEEVEDDGTARVNDFNILVVVARRNIDGPVEISDRWSPIQLLIALFRVQRDLWWSGGRQQINLEVVRPGSFEEFENQLAWTRGKRGKIHAVHFDVHGDVPNDDSAVLEFNSWNENTEEWDSDPRECGPIARVLSAHEVPCLILGACKSAHSDAYATANLSWQFVLEGIPNVVAMSYNMSDAMAYIFFLAFYRSLLIGRQELGHAVRIARRKLYEKRKRYSYTSQNSVNLEDWFVPVLYTRGRRFRVESDQTKWNWLISRLFVRWCFAPQQWYLRAALCLIMLACWILIHTASSANRMLSCSFCRFYLEIASVKWDWGLIRLLNSVVFLTSFAPVQNSTGMPSFPIDVQDYVYHWTPTHKILFIIFVWAAIEVNKTLLPWINNNKFIRRALLMVRDKQNILRIEGNLRRAKIVIVYQDVPPSEAAYVTAKETLDTLFEIWKRTNCIDHVVIKRAEWLLHLYNSQSYLVHRLICFTRLWMFDIGKKHKEYRGCHPRSVILIEDLDDIRPLDTEKDRSYHQKSRKELASWLSKHFARGNSDGKSPYLVMTFLSREAVYSSEDEIKGHQALEGMGVRLEDIAYIKFTPLAGMNFLHGNIHEEIFSDT